MVSAKASMADIEQGLALGADEYITKPFDIRLVSKVISKLLASVSSIVLRKSTGRIYILSTSVR